MVAVGHRKSGVNAAAMDFFNGQNWGALFVASEWVIRLVMLVIVPFRRSPEAAKGWLLLVFFLPWIGLALYLLIGRPTYPRWRTERFRRIPEAFQPVRERLGKKLEEFSPSLPEPLASAALLVQNLGRHRVVGGNEVELLGGYDDAIDRLVADIDNAKSHVHLILYIFSDDSVGTKVIDALGRAVKRGVEARVLVDFIGSSRWWRSLSKKMEAAGVTIHHALAVGLLRRKSARADLRNHRKIAVIDGRVAYTGSQNLTEATFKSDVVFKELVARITGPVVLQFQAVFASDWFMETEETLDAPHLFPTPVATGAVAAQVLASGPDYPAANMHEIVLALIYGARKRVVITTPYFIPDKALLVALDTAVRRGVEVELFVSRTTDEPLVNLAQQSYYEELMDFGVRVHRYREKFLHAKHLSVDDDVVVVGSSNMDIRSFLLNAEVSLIAFDGDVTARLREHERQYVAGSERLSMDEWTKRSLASKVLENLARLMSPLL
jgi:cardiolipin synthase A/B